MNTKPFNFLLISVIGNWQKPITLIVLYILIFFIYDSLIFNERIQTVPYLSDYSVKSIFFLCRLFYIDG